MADRLIASSDSTTSYTYDEEVFITGLANVTSVHGASVTGIPLFIAKRNGRITDVFIGAVPAVSAASFTGDAKGNVSVNVRVNSVSCLSTLPAILAPVGSAGQGIFKATNAVSASAAGGPANTSAVVNSASANFSTGDLISLDYNAQSVGSGAPTATGTGLTATVVVRYSPS